MKPMNGITIFVSKKNKRKIAEELISGSKIPYAQVEKDAAEAKERIKKRRMAEGTK